MRRAGQKSRVGELRPSQLLYAYGVGSVVDLPNLSAMVMGLDDWDRAYSREIGEERLLVAVRQELGEQVERLLTPPEAPDLSTAQTPAFLARSLVGVPVATFPRWMLCPRCRLLAPLRSGLFDRKSDEYHPDRTRYVHSLCGQGAPTVLPARFLVACERAHLDDFPWVSFTHRGETECRYRLQLFEVGMTGEAVDVVVKCSTCGVTRRMSDAFGEEGKQSMPECAGRWPHLRSYDDQDCPEQMRAILLGASNSWFPLVVSALSIPTGSDRLSQLVQEHWVTLEHTQNMQNIELLINIGQLRAFHGYAAEEVWAAVESKRGGAFEGGEPVSLKTPEWHIFSQPDPTLNTDDFRLRPVKPPVKWVDYVETVVLVERLREVRALVGFTRIESPGEFEEVLEVPDDRRAPLARRAPTWLPASEVRGEGIFIQMREETIERWTQAKAAVGLGQVFHEAHTEWRRRRGIPNAELAFPGLRYILLHSFSHAILRQLALECGYSMASIRERIYSLPPHSEEGPMSGLLLYTSAPDSEGTLGGLVSLGEPDRLGHHIEQALEQVMLCASDPLCSEHRPHLDAVTLHGAACHACLFLPETSCERGNKYLDRSVLVPTLQNSGTAFFRSPG